ncbi:MAG TPA: hypothetical protein VEP50_07545 [bacterium]|nr:hypothetical protein [bacterium]
MRLRTASQVITFVKKVESDSAELYDKLAEMYKDDGNTFRAFSAENRRNAVDIERAYYSVITDAIEGGYAFDLETDRYAFAIALTGQEPMAVAVGKAIGAEQKILQFYADAVGQSKSLMADIPRAFEVAARRRRERQQKLNRLVGAEPV